MAKQVGLFGLRGKIENKSFYKTAGVSDTVIRQIPEGLSARVKTADEYANTRLNNAEFKNANGLASFLFNAVPNRKSSMMRRFAIAEMTKKGLEYIKLGEGPWGQRVPEADFDQIAVDLLENRAKSGTYQNEFGEVAVSIDNDGIATITVTPDELTIQDMENKGIDGYIALDIRGGLGEEYVDGFLRQYFGHSMPSPHPVSSQTAGTASVTITVQPTATAYGMSPSGWTRLIDIANSGLFGIITFLPYREIDGARHALYEYSTFVCYSLGHADTY